MMRVVPVLLLLLALLLTPALPASAASAASGAAGAAGAAGAGPPRIVGGSVVAIDDFPYQAAVVVALGGGTSTRCGGAILEASLIATAAHCLRHPDTGAPVPAGAVQVRAGSARIADVAANQQRRTAARYVPHPGYDGTYADAALITLDAPLDLGGPRARAIALTDAGDAAASEPGDMATVSGWGTTTAGGVPSPDLRAVDVPLVSDLACAAAYGAFRAASLVCAGDLVDGGEDACQGDSGGPLVVRSGGVPKLVGIVSSGVGCADPDCPGIYTEVMDPPVRSFLARTPLAAADPRIVVGGPRPTCTTEDVDGPLPSPAPLPPAPVPAPPAPAPAPSPAPPATAPAAPASPAPAPALPPAIDTTRPVVAVGAPRCVRGRCTYTVRVTDPGVSAGVRALSATFSSRARLRCAGRRGTCLRTVRRPVAVSRRAAATWRLTVHGVPAGRHVLRVVARDGAGLRSAPAIRVSRTRGARRARVPGR